MELLEARDGLGAAMKESERILDAALECTFPASDPVAVQSAFEAACEREQQQPGDVSGE